MRPLPGCLTAHAGGACRAQSAHAAARRLGRGLHPPLPHASPFPNPPQAGVNTPGATYNIQLLEVVNGSSPTTYAAMGKSPGFFVLTPIDPRPSWLMALVGVFCCIGPLTLAGFFYVEKIYRKQK